MKKYGLILISGILVLSIAFISCKRTISGSGPVLTEGRPVKGFTEITLEIPAKITVAVADSFNCIITAQPNILKAIKTVVSGNELRISSPYSFDDTKIEMVISLPGINALTINGSGEMKTLNVIKSETLHLNVNGSGALYVNSETDKLRCEINGSGSCFVRGSSKKHKCEINGSGDLHAFDLSCVESAIDVNGSGDAEVSVTDQLNAAIHGSGNIIYKGSPHIKSEIAGSGTIKKYE